MATRREQLNDRIRNGYLDEETVFVTGFDEAILGTVEHAGKHGIAEVVAYDADRIVAMLVERGMDTADAAEYFSFNVLGGYVGEFTPAFVSLIEDTDD